MVQIRLLENAGFYHARARSVQPNDSCLLLHIRQPVPPEGNGRRLRLLFCQLQRRIVLHRRNTLGRNVQLDALYLVVRNSSGHIKDLEHGAPRLSVGPQPLRASVSYIGQTLENSMPATGK